MSTKRRYLNRKDGPIAVDTDYDDRSLLPRQSFFPMDGTSGSRANLARNLRAEVDTLQTKAYRGTASQSFKADEHRCALVKIVDNRDTETLKIVELR